VFISILTCFVDQRVDMRTLRVCDFIRCWTEVFRSWS